MKKQFATKARKAITVNLLADVEFMGLMMVRRNIDAGIAEQRSEKIKLGLIQFGKKKTPIRMKTTLALYLFESGVVIDRRTNTITTLTYPESVKLSEKKNG